MNRVVYKHNQITMVHAKGGKAPMNKLYQQIKSRGFSIIEVVLVLAIAGLIFLAVFIALPALQANQRDSDRKRDVSTIVTGINDYRAGNKQKFPTTQQLTGNTAGDPTNESSWVKNISSNTTAVVVNTTAGAGQLNEATLTDGKIVVTQRSTCGSVSKTAVTLTAGTTQQFTVVTRLEAGGGSFYCQDA